MDGICFYNRHVITGRGTHPVTLCGNDIESNECANVERRWRPHFIGMEISCQLLVMSFLLYTLSCLASWTDGDCLYVHT